MQCDATVHAHNALIGPRSPFADSTAEPPVYLCMARLIHASAAAGMARVITVGSAQNGARGSKRQPVYGLMASWRKGSAKSTRFKPPRMRVGGARTDPLLNDGLDGHRVKHSCAS